MSRNNTSQEAVTPFWSNSLEKRSKGIWIDARIVIDNDLTWMEKLFLTEICYLDQGQDGCFASNSHFAGLYNLTSSRCSQIINSLKKKQYIAITYHRIEKRISYRSIHVIKKGIKNLTRGIKNSKHLSKNTKEPYVENAKESNTLDNNTKSTKGESRTIPPYGEIIDHLNATVHTNYKASSKTTQSLINARYHEGFSCDDFITVINTKAKSWADDPKLAQYLRPQTLFGNKFESYLNEPRAEEEQPSAMYIDWRNDK